MRTTRWQYPEYLSATDSHLVGERRLIAEYGRGNRNDIKVADVTTAEAQVVALHEKQGVHWDDDYGQKRDKVARTVDSVGTSGRKKKKH